VSSSPTPVEARVATVPPVGRVIHAAVAATRQATLTCAEIGDTRRRARTTVERSRELRAEMARAREERARAYGRPGGGSPLLALRAATERLIELTEAESRRQSAPAAAPDPATPALLTVRQLEILGLVAEGVGTEEIAQRLWLSVATVRNHVARTLRTLDAHSRVEAVAKARRLNLL
jgi:DNA-binding NarL/FixJ family response regulator